MRILTSRDRIDTSVGVQRVHGCCREAFELKQIAFGSRFILLVFVAYWQWWFEVVGRSRQFVPTPGRSMRWLGIWLTTRVGLGGCIMASDGWFSFGLLLLPEKGMNWENYDRRSTSSYVPKRYASSASVQV